MKGTKKESKEKECMGWSFKDIRKQGEQDEGKRVREKQERKRERATSRRRARRRREGKSKVGPSRRWSKCVGERKLVGREVEKWSLSSSSVYLQEARLTCRAKSRTESRARTRWEVVLIKESSRQEVS